MEAIDINKQQYLAELEKLLGFMSSWDREEQMKKYEALFANCRDEHELIDILGTPTKIAIGIARNYTPTEAPVAKAPEEPEPVAESAPEPEKEETPVPVENEPEAEPENTDTTETEIPAMVEEKPDEAIFESSSAVDESEKPALYIDEPVPTPAPVVEEEEDDEEEYEERTTKVRVIPAFLYTIIAIIVGVPFAVLFFAVSLVFVVIGVVLIAAAVVAVKSVILSIVMISDIMILCGAGLVVVAVGIIIAWFGIWLCTTLLRGWIGTCLIGLGRKICIKEVD